jgi:hypothetical protein
MHMDAAYGRVLCHCRQQAATGRPGTIRGMSENDKPDDAEALTTAPVTAQQNPYRDYDRGEGALFLRGLLAWLGGCGIVVLIVIFCFALYALLLTHSGWHG